MKQLKRVLILFASSGAGHLSPTLALKEQFEARNIKVSIFDLYDKSNQTKSNFKNLFDQIVDDRFYELVSTNPLFDFLGRIFWRFTSTKFGTKLLVWFTKLVKNKILKKVIEESDADLIISTHPLTTALLEDSNFKFVNVITDLDKIHNAWISTHSILNVAPSNEVIETLTLSGINSEKITGPLYPIRSMFKSTLPWKEVLTNLDLKTDRKTILITGGASAIKLFENIIDQLQEYQLIILTGKSEDSFKKFSEKYKGKENIKICGFREDMNNLLNSSDTIITKPGTNIIKEIEHLNRSAIFINAVGAQEEGNLNYIKTVPRFRYAGNDAEKIKEMVKEKIDMTEEKKDFETEKIVDEVIRKFNSN